ncbi:three component ABC system middle component [Erwinia billingiae]|uniref:three component ABC system middle component n=1 Tax=Erwinia billingiae TaxID=182337 RepID=UPI00320AF0A9
MDTQDIILNLNREEINLYNPYYCSIFSYSMILSYEKYNQGGIDTTVFLLALPLIMNKEIILNMPYTSKTTFLTWLDENQWILVDFDKKIAGFMDVSLITLRTLLSYDLITLSKNGKITVNQENKMPSIKAENKGDSYNLKIKAANIIGKWFAQNSSPSLFKSFGIQP